MHSTGARSSSYQADLRDSTSEASDCPCLSLSLAETVASIDDLLAEILLHLPVRSLFRFKLVSKHWFSLITNPNFCRRHHKPCTPSAFFLERLSFTGQYCEEHEFLPVTNDDPSLTPPFRTLTFAPDPSGLQIVQSCNGLLFCSSVSEILPEKKYFVYNPSTNHFVTIPITRSGMLDLWASLAFDPSKSPHYKVICVWRSDLNGVAYFQIEIYSSETGVWGVSGQHFTVTNQYQFNDPMFYCNGAIHWFSHEGESLYFNIEQEQLQRLPRPSMLEDWEDRALCYHGESNNHFNFVEVYNHRSPQFDVYELESDCSGWFVKYKVDLGPVATAFPELIMEIHRLTPTGYYNFALLSIVHGETEDDSFLLLHFQCKIIRYNFVDKTFKVLCDFGPNRVGLLSDGGWFSAYPFIESLACV